MTVNTPRKRSVVLLMMVVLTAVTIAVFHDHLQQHLKMTFKQFILPGFRNLTGLKLSSGGLVDSNSTSASITSASIANQTQSVNDQSGGLWGSKLTRPPASPATGVKRKKMVYACRSGGCGGWADRQKGIVSTYVLAAMLDRDFGIRLDFPCDLGQIFNVNKIDWRVADKQLQGPDSQQYSIMDHGAVVFTQNLVSKPDLSPEFPRDVSVMTWNMEVVKYLQQHKLASRIDWLAGKPYPEVYKRILGDLFSLKPDLQNKLEALQKSRPPGTQLVCAQVRLGKHNGSFPDVDTWHTFEDFAILVNFLAKYNDSSRFRILFASDSVEIIQRAKNKFPLVFLNIPGPITHTDKSSGSDACDGFKKAVLDQYALSMCDILVISESGIGKIAAFLRGSDKDLYLFHDVHIKAFSRSEKFPNKSGW